MWCFQFHGDEETSSTKYVTELFTPNNTKICRVSKLLYQFFVVPSTMLFWFLYG